MYIIMLGGPGSGKGSVGGKISEDLKLPHIATGYIFRAELKNETELGKKIKKYMDNGLLVPDEVVIEIVENRLSQDDAKNGAVLDGFPRTKDQAIALDKFLAGRNQKVNAAIEAKNNGTLNEELQQFDLEYIKSLPVDECHKALQNFMGVGAKVADCIMLFSMSKHSAFPVDVWIKRAMIHFYLAPDVSLNKIRVFGREKFGELAGLAQQYLFYYARENNIKVE